MCVTCAGDPCTPLYPGDVCVVALSSHEGPGRKRASPHLQMPDGGLAAACSGGAERGAEQAARPLRAPPVRCCLAGNRRCKVVAHPEVSSEQVSSRTGTGRPRQCEARAGQPVATGSPPPFRCSCTFLVAGVGWELVRTARWPPRGPRAPGAAATRSSLASEGAGGTGRPRLAEQAPCVRQHWAGRGEGPRGWSRELTIL